MKIKAITFAILSSMILTACGGGGSGSKSSSNSGNTDNSGNTNTSADSEWAMYTSGSSTDDVNLFTKLKYTISNNNAYINAEYNAAGSSNLNISDFSQSYLSTDGLYDASKTKTDLGYHFGKFISKSDTVWTFTPYSSNGNTALQLTEKFEKVDLSGKSISEYVDGFNHYTGLNAALKTEVGDYPAYYVQKLQGKTFPSGASCLRSISSSSNKDFAYVDYSYPSSSYEPNYYFDGDFRTLTLGSFPLYLANDLEYYSESEATTKIGTDYYSANYYQQGTYYTLASHIADYQKDLDNAIVDYGKDSNEAQVQDAYLKGLKTECTLFNKTASTAIDAVK